MYIGAGFWKFQFSSSRGWGPGVCARVYVCVSVCIYVWKIPQRILKQIQGSKFTNILNSFSAEIHCFRATLCRFHVCQLVIGLLLMRLQSKGLAELLNV